MPYKLDTYIKCREKIDKIIRKVGYTVNQKELFIKIVKEISTIPYSSKYKEMQERGHGNLNDFNTNYAFRNIYIPCSNLEGLITGSTVCGGFSDIINNIMSCYGIESIAVIGDENLESYHIWNQVKLDGVWYNADVTFDAKNIKKNKQAYWLLRSDKDFLTDINGKGFCIDHFPSKKSNGVIHKCSVSIPYEEINMYLNGSAGTGGNDNFQIVGTKQKNDVNDVTMEK